MSDDTANKWNERYAHAGEAFPAPAEVLSAGKRWLSAADACRAKEAGDGPARALDLACGRGGNAHFLAQRGYQVFAWDISEKAISSIQALQPNLIFDATVRDVCEHPPEPDSFDLIVVCRFLERKLCPAISAALKPGGLLFYQTFTHGLSNPDFLLKPNELLSLFDGLNFLEYHEPGPDESGRAEARLVACKPQ